MGEKINVKEIVTRKKEELKARDKREDKNEYKFY